MKSRKFQRGIILILVALLFTSLNISARQREVKQLKNDSGN